MLRKWSALVLLLLATPFAVMAQTTGKISGTVIDAETGEPLPGANVVIEGSLQGTATDIDGQYNILEVQPGVYTLLSSFAGYTTERRQNVEIIAGITNRVNFELRPSTLELDMIEVTAERPLVNVTATNAVRRVDAEIIQSLPTRDVSTYYAIQPGVTVLNNEVYIRGGRPDETNFLLEGISSRSLIGFDNVVPVIPEALEEVQVFAGGYSAELGNANAGIVQQVFKTGGRTLSGLVQYETDGGADVFGAPSYGYSDITATIGGPLVWKQHRFFGAISYNKADDYKPAFWYGADLGLPVDETIKDSPVGELNWGDNNIPGKQRPRERLMLNGTLSFDFSPLRLRIGYAQMNQDRTNNDTPIRSFYNQLRLTSRDDMSRLLNATATYFLSDKTFLEANAGLFQYTREDYDPLFGAPKADGKGGALLDMALWYNQDAVYDKVLADAGEEAAAMYSISGPGGWVSAWNDPGDYVFNGFRFDRPGQVQQNYLHRDQSRYDLGLKLTSQFDNHYVVLGGDYSRWTARDYSMRGAVVAGSIDSLNSNYANLIRAEADTVALNIRRAGYGGYGYDEFMNEVNDGPNGPKHPTTAALFINDRIEFNDIVVNAGLRLDYFDLDLFEPTDTDGNVNYERPQFDLASYSVEGLKATKGKTVIQPRLGLSFPITNRTAFHLQYGKFAQMPDMFYVYRRPAYIALVLSGQNFIPTPFAWDLDPITSSQYEIGVGHQFSDFAAFDLTAFYRRTQGQLEIVRVNTVQGTAAQDYNIFANGDFAIARGIELSVRTQRVAGFMGLFNYTLTDAKGTNSEPGGQVSALENGTLPPTLIQPLSFEQRHRGSAVLDYRTGRTGNQALANITAALLFNFNSGSRFTRSAGSIGQRAPDEAGLLEGTDPRGRSPLEPLNASTTPWYFNTDLRLEKGLSVGPARATVFGYVQNLFNTKNALNVYLRSGTPDNDGFLYTPELSDKLIEARGQGFVDYYTAIDVQNRQHYVDTQGYDIYDTPRQIRIGVRVDF